jgi:hypothetical protein
LSLESIDNDYARGIKLEDGQQLKWWKYISDYWEEEPTGDVLSVILSRPAGSECQLVLSTFDRFILTQCLIASLATITPTSSIEDKLSDESKGTGECQ